MRVIHTARRRKMRIPDDLSVVGVDDIRYARYTDLPLTTVAQPMRQMGENAVRVLLDILNGGNGARADDAAAHTRGAREHRAAWAVVNDLSVEFPTNTRPLTATSLIAVVTRYFFFRFSSIVRV
jgi:substrate-binding family protein